MHFSVPPIANLFPCLFGLVGFGFLGFVLFCFFWFNFSSLYKDFQPGLPSP